VLAAAPRSAASMARKLSIAALTALYSFPNTRSS
jgi:hypothetical protein